MCLSLNLGLAFAEKTTRTSANFLNPITIEIDHYNLENIFFYYDVFRYIYIYIIYINIYIMIH